MQLLIHIVIEVIYSLSKFKIKTNSKKTKIMIINKVITNANIATLNNERVRR